MTARNRGRRDPQEATTPAPRKAKEPTLDSLVMERVLALPEGWQAAFWTDDGEADYQPIAALALLREKDAGLVPASLVARGGRWALAEADERFLGLGYGIEDVDAYGDAAADAAGDGGDDDDTD